MFCTLFGPMVPDRVHAGGAPLGQTGLALCVTCNVPGGGEVVFVKISILFFKRQKKKIKEFHSASP